MEKNIHDEHLDDYVKKSFEEYAENPSSDMWDRIEGQIAPTEDRKPAWFAWRGYRWQLAAAAVILTLASRLVCVQHYYENKLRIVSGQQQQVLHHSAPTTVLPPTPLSSLPDQPTANSQQNIESTIPALQAKTQKNSLETQSDFQVISVGKSIYPKPSTIFPSMMGENISLIPAPEMAGIPIPNEVVAPTGTSLAMARSVAQFDNFPSLDQKEPLLTFPRKAHAALYLDVPIKKHKVPTSWYIGVAVSPHLIIEKSRRTLRPGTGNPRQLYASLQERPKVSADVSLRVGKKINTRFSLESGIGFQQLSKTATHRPQFQYQEGHLDIIGMTESRSFDYDLNTYGGSASVSLRTEVSGSNIPAETERVGVVINSREQIQLLHIPLLGVARVGHGRMQAVIKAGILGSYILKKEFSLSAYTLENTKLRLRGNEGYTVQYNRPQHFIFGYQASFGAEFRVNKSISIAAAPTLSGDFPRSVMQRGRLPGHTSFGMNVGANWWF